MATKKKASPDTIAVNRRARFDYQIEERFEAGLVLMGWEVKSLRAGKAEISEAYVIVRGAESWLVGAHFQALTSASTHVTADPTRTRKLLLHRKELNKLIGAVEKKGYTLVPIRLYWNKGKAKIEIGLARGKKQFEKRDTTKKRDWERQKARIMKGR